MPKRKSVIPAVFVMIMGSQPSQGSQRVTESPSLRCSGWLDVIKYRQRDGRNALSWSKIKEGKCINDKLKSKVYARANRHEPNYLIHKDGNSVDPAINTALATAISRAKQNGVPRSNIQTALEQAQKNQASGSDLYVYEVLFAGKVGLVIECLSDNNVRTRGRKDDYLPYINRAQMASVAYMFDRKMTVHVSLRPEQSYESFWSFAVENGAHDIHDQPEVDEQSNHDVEIITSREEGGELMKKLEKEGYDVSHSDLVYIPLQSDSALGEDTIRSLDEFIKDLDDYPDVYNISISPPRA
ncbi:hypothetical protein Clacol_006627 [Clathrus columnatus]|uniref:Uncharacterized protein n=1 Tax=Clathrus columnatus TaxID=1419009 RepID=A0AAV5AKB1_9AGAM|nr:hypothetical protein Clacol_006627 [Clathrus columnatus]